MPYRPDPPSDDGPGDPAEENKQVRDTAEESHPDAFGAVSQPPGDRGGVRGGDRAPATSPTDRDVARLTTRDIAVIRHLVLLRVLTYDQLHRLAFASSDPSITRRRIRHLARTGWLSSWEAPSLRGGHTRYAHPSANAIRALLPKLGGVEPWAPLIGHMVPRSQRRPLMLGDRAPKWLAHQREVNHLVTSMVTSPERQILWASSWDCPFPSRISMFTMPQPDYVLVEEVNGALAEFPEVCEQQFGITTFRVDVTVIDPVRRAPLARLRSLLDAARSSMRPDIFRFTLGGWLYADPSAAIWFSTDGPPQSDSVACSDHAASLGAA
jgi:hypothetical protein